MPDAEILLYDEIGFFGTSAKAFAEGLSAAGDGPITLRLNSPGGDCADGLAIYNLLLAEKRKGRKITVAVDGLAASMASVIAMAGDEVHMAESSMLMVHNPWGVVRGDAEELRAQAEVFDKLKGLLVAAYSKKTGKRADTIARLMDAETWLTAAEAKAEGFADRVLPPPRGAMNRFRLDAYAKAPPAALALFAQRPAHLPAPTGHDAPTEVQTMSETNAAPPPASDAVTIGKAELAELRAIKAAAVAATGCETGLKGALEALKANADRAQAADAKLAVRKVVDSMIAKGQIAPRQRDHYEAQDLADVEAAARVLVASPPPRAAADPGPAEGGLPPVAGKGKPTKRAYNLIGHTAPEQE